MNVQDLPDDILYRVFRYTAALPRFREHEWRRNLALLAVCSRWRLCAMPLVYRSVSISCVGKGIARQLPAGSDPFGATVSANFFGDPQRIALVKELDVHIVFLDDLVMELEKVVAVLEYVAGQWPHVQGLVVRAACMSPNGLGTRPSNPQLVQLMIRFSRVLPGLKRLEFPDTCQGDSQSNMVCGALADVYAPQICRLLCQRPVEFTGMLGMLSWLDCRLGSGSHPVVDSSVLVVLQLSNVPADFTWSSFQPSGDIQPALIFPCLEKLALSYSNLARETLRLLYGSLEPTKLQFPRLRHLRLSTEEGAGFPILKHALFPREISYVYLHGSASDIGEFGQQRSKYRARSLSLSVVGRDSSKIESDLNAICGICRFAQATTKVKYDMCPCDGHLPVPSEIAWPTCLTHLLVGTPIQFATVLALVHKLPRVTSFSATKINAHEPLPYLNEAAVRLDSNIAKLLLHFTDTAFLCRESLLAMFAKTLVCIPADHIRPDDEATIPGTKLFWQELWWVFTSSVPLALTYLCEYSFNFVSLISVGNLGVNELAAASLANMIINFVALMPAVGLAGALETFCAAEYTASTDKTRVGFHMQRGLVVITLQLVPGILLFSVIDTLLMWIGQTEEVATLCARFLRIWLLGAWLQLAFECLKRFTQAQGLMRAGTTVMSVVVPIHWFFSYLLVWSPVVGLGFVGAPITNVISSWLLFSGMVLYIALSRARECWGGWTWSCLDGIWEYYRVAIPGAAMVACSWASFEVMTFCASVFGPVKLAAQACIVSAMAVGYQAPSGVGSAAAARIGNLLGLGKQRRASYSAHAAIALGYAIGLSCSVLLFTNRHRWGYIFSNDVRVVEVCAGLVPYLAAVQTYDGLNGVLSGILRALGKQKLGVQLAFPSYWVLGIPLGIFCAFGYPGMGISGLWLGTSSSVLVFSGVQQWYVFFRVDWLQELKICLDRLARSARTGSSPAPTSSYGPLAEASV
ncbi:ethionine resistance protein [Coemansia sp. RSA 552]|nr:ethionine resistance protein [Coemansia sp. RSA 552]